MLLKEFCQESTSPLFFSLYTIYQLLTEVLLLVYKALSSMRSKYNCNLPEEYKPTRVLRSSGSSKLVEPWITTEHYIIFFILIFFNNVFMYFNFKNTVFLSLLILFWFYLYMFYLFNILHVSLPFVCKHFKKLLCVKLAVQIKLPCLQI